MRSTIARITIAIVIFAAALGGALVLLQARNDDGRPSSGVDRDDPASGALTSDVWKVGDRWTVKVRQDAGAITPDGTKSVVAVPYRFQVVKAPEDEKGAWLVQVMQDGADGPFAAGWKLQYRAEGDALVLWRVAVGAEPALEAELASIVLGPQFPYETRYDTHPKNMTIDAAKLIARTALPPAALPSGSHDPGATPPAQAPRAGAGGAPVAPRTPVAPPA